MDAIKLAVAELHRMYPQAAHSPSFGRAVWGMVMGTLVVGALFWLAETLWPEDREQPKWRPDSKTDLFYWFFDFFVGRRIVGFATGVVLVAMVLLRLPHHVTAISRLPLWLQGLLALLVGDFAFYWAHRLLHTVPALWRIHAVHHSSRKLDWLASARVHPLEGVWTRLVSVVPLFLLGISPKMIAAYVPVLSIYPIFLHCNLSWGYGRLGRVVASPAFHRWHHTSEEVALDKNFSGMFPLFDFLFGTAYFPADCRPTAYGLHCEEMPATIRGQLLYPFRRS